jgi:hypothetical protein
MICAVLPSCGKDDSSTEPTTAPTASGTGADTDSDPVITENMENPVGSLTLATLALSTAGEHIGAVSATSALKLEDGEDFNPTTHCDDNGEAKALATDAEEFVSAGGELHRSHPRAAFQHFYCMMQKDTGNSTTFVGAITGTKLYACLISGVTLDFSGAQVEVEAETDNIRACWKDEFGYEDAEMDEMLPAGETIDVKVTSEAPAAFGGEGWDGSIRIEASLGEDAADIQILIKDSDQKFGIAVISNGSSPIQTDAVRVGIDRETGEVWYDGLFQRMRANDDSFSTGWNRHGVGYVKGTMDEEYRFSEVEKFFGAYSDISVEAGGVKVDTLSRGEMWTINGGTPSQGLVTNSYELTCAGAGDCEDPNLIASWVAVSEETTGACNGAAASDSNTCEVDGIEMTTDAHTGFMMDPESTNYVITETWFAELAFPSYTSLTLDLSQE